MDQSRKTFIVLALVLSLFVLVLSAPSKATAGEYDGVWLAAGVFDSAFIIRHTDGTILLAQVFLSEGGIWNGFSGPISGTKAELNTLISELNLDANIDFLTPEAGIMTINSCTADPGNEECPPDGAQFELNKIF